MFLSTSWERKRNIVFSTGPPLLQNRRECIVQQYSVRGAAINSVGDAGDGSPRNV